MYTDNNPKLLEKYSSAVTLSDMEMFLFPELIYSLVMANIMSPRLWLWREDPWFKKIDKMNPQRRIQRLKQFIMDHFSFNLDLETWGLTTKESELSRFETFIDRSVLSESNALFGYEGDKYYFDIDIRRHFGLDKYTSDIIPYWKTETLEAMEAFRFKDNYPAGAGECVSLAALYAAASFVVAKIPLGDIYLMTTPLHSQNYLDVNDGILTNNRRIVTKTMWYNGTELSAKARRALQNEQITLVAHNSGYIHTTYDRATINPQAYSTFKSKLRNYLKTEINYEVIANFLRYNSKLQSCFQLTHDCCGKPRYIDAEKVYSYEHSSKFRVGSSTQSHLLQEIEEDDYYTEANPNRILLEELERFFIENRVLVDDAETIDKLLNLLHHNCFNVQTVVHDLIEFCKITPRLPSDKKYFKEEKTIEMDGVGGAEEAQAYLQSIRNESLIADLAFSAFRDLSTTPWKPFLKAALQRNPVCLHATESKDLNNIYSTLISFPNESIYPGDTRLAQPDEVWNFGRGDGLERALCLLAVYTTRYQRAFNFSIDDRTVIVTLDGQEYRFPTRKAVPPPRMSDFDF